MTEQNGQLAADHRDIQQRFSASPHIEVRGSQGNPPHAYEIKYRLKGLHKDADGRVDVVEVHTVWIDLPYGYPIFPPVCKAVSPIFHPDFGPETIFTSDFWKNTPSLPELIIHIGRLIAFQLYSHEDVGNSEALEWIRANGDQLPLDKADLASSDSIMVPVEEKHGPDHQEEDREPLGLEDAPEVSPGAAKDATGRLPAEAVKPAEDVKPAEVVKPAEAVKPAKVVKPPKSVKADLPKSETSRRGLGLRIVVATLIVVALVAGVGSFYMRNLWLYEGAVQQWTTVDPLIKQGKFKEADRQLEDIWARLDKVRLVRKDEKLHLLGQINKLRSTESFRQGLLGSVLFKGHYYSTEEIASYHDLENRLAKAEALASAGRWQEAVEEYMAASQKTILLGERAPVSKDLVRQALNYARLQEQIAIGNRLKAGKEWSAAETQFKMALHLLAEIREDLDPLKAKEFEASLGSTVADLQKYILEEAFAAAIDRGERFFAKKQWSKAIAGYENALRIAGRAGGELAAQAKKFELYLEIARFNIMYEKGTAELKAGNWHESIQQLEMSEKLRRKIAATGAAVEVGEEMIQRKILVARISREKNAVSLYVGKKEYAHANEALAAIVSLIDRSELAGDREFAMAKTAAANQITENIFLMEIEELKVYLVKNYQEIFIKYFPSSASADLSNPAISFVEQDGSFLYFSMQCKAKRKRLHSTLELAYKFNRETGKWSVRK